MKAKKPVSIVLSVPNDITSKCLYRDACSTQFEYDNHFATHVTLCYKPNEEQRSYWKQYIGNIVQVGFDRLFYNNMGMAYRVSLPKHIVYFGESTPHLTVATSGETPPSYSNDLMTMTGEVSTRFQKCGFLTQGTVAYCKVAALVYGREGKEYRTELSGLKM